jgi:hypothetical protein
VVREDELMADHWLRSPRTALGAALLVPPVVCVALVPFRDNFDTTNGALVLVLVVVGVAALGHRVAGAVAALSSGLWFDFFLTRPYERFAISDRSQLETAALLLLVGLGVTELAVWGRREQARASRDEGYLAGMFAASQAGARGGASLSNQISAVCQQLVDVLGLVSCRFDYGTGLGYPRLSRDGKVTWDRRQWDVHANGLPTEKEIELLVQSGGSFRGRFLLTAGPGTRPSATQVQVATTLADEVGATLAGYTNEHP